MRTRFDGRKVVKAARAGSVKSLGHAGGMIRLTARRSIKRSPTESPPGTPPHTRKGQIKRALRYAVEKEKQTVVVGPEAEVVGTSGKAHEFGGRFSVARRFVDRGGEKLKRRVEQRDQFAAARGRGCQDDRTVLHWDA